MNDNHDDLADGREPIGDPRPDRRAAPEERLAALEALAAIAARRMRQLGLV